MVLNQELISRLRLRHVTREDLPALEWDGEYTHFRRIFELAYRDARTGKALLWIAALPGEDEICGQVFVQLRSAVRPEIADGHTTAYLYSVRVKSGYRNQGVGEHMMRMVEQDLKKRGFRVAGLNVAQDNAPAYRFYTRIGYRKVGTEPGQWSYVDHEGHRQYVDEPAWRLEKRL